MWRKGAFSALTFVAALAATVPAWATVMVELSVDDLTERSRAVVRATVRQHQSVWNADHTRIHTLAELEVHEVIRGEAPATILVRTLGGAVDGIGMKVSGAPQLRVDEEVVVFLRADPLQAGTFTVVGMSQGLYRLELDTAGRKVAVPGVEGLAFVRKTGEGPRIVDHRSDAVRVPYENLRARVIAVGRSPVTPLNTPARPSVPAVPTAPTAPDAQDPGR